MEVRSVLNRCLSLIYEKRTNGGSIFQVEKYKFFRITLLRRIKSSSGIEITLFKFFNFKRPLSAIESKLSIDDRAFDKVDVANDDNDALVSVIVPNYNHAPYLRQRLDSIYNQTYQNIEVILLDDASTDNSLSILKEYGLKYSHCTRMLFNEDNSGKVFHQWNKGLSQARGEYIWIAESDDYCDRNFLKEVVQGLKHQSVMLSFARSVFVQEGKKIWTQEAYLRDLPVEWNAPFVMTAHTLVSKAFAIKNVVPNVSSAVFRNVGHIPAEVTDVWNNMSLCGDWLFYLWLIRGGAVSYTNRVNNYYRIHPQSTSLKIQNTLNYYTETLQISCYVAQHYAVDLSVFDVVKSNLKKHYIEHHQQDAVTEEVGAVAEEVEKAYNQEEIRAAASSRSINVIVCGYALTQGGGEIFPIYLANELKHQGLAVTFMDFREEPCDEMIRRKLLPGIPLVRLSNVLLLKSAIASLGAEIVHTHQADTDGAVAFAIGNKQNPCKHIVTLHGMYEAISAAKLQPILHQVVKSCSCFVYIAQKNLLPMKDVLPSVKLHKIGNGLPLIEIEPHSRQQMGIEEDAFCLTLASRAIPEKGWMEAVEAVKRVNKQSARPVHLILIGDGECYDKLQQSPLPSFIHVMGRRADVRNYFAMSDVGLLPSRFKGESFPLVIIEGFQCGIPVIATDVGEIRSMITSETGEMAGTLLQLHGGQISVDELSDIILQLTNSDYYNQLKENVEKVVSKFDMSHTAQQYIKVYKEALATEALSQHSLQNNTPCV